jgi:hypothetical protein
MTPASRTFTAPRASRDTVSLPNFFFHVTTAYDILRHKGLQIGKKELRGGTGAVAECSEIQLPSIEDRT